LPCPPRSPNCTVARCAPCWWRAEASSWVISYGKAYGTKRGRSLGSRSSSGARQPRACPPCPSAPSPPATTASTSTSTGIRFRTPHGLGDPRRPVRCRAVPPFQGLRALARRLGTGHRSELSRRVPIGPGLLPALGGGRHQSALGAFGAARRSVHCALLVD